MIKRAIFLDRDGVINRAIVRDGKPYPPLSINELEILPEVPQALEQFKARGFLLIVVTNQPDVARGTQSIATVEAMHAQLKAQLVLDEFRVCYHDDRNNCQCRKPNPGLLRAAAADYGLNLCASYMIGDRWRDMEAGRRAGCSTIFVDYHYAEKQPEYVDLKVSSLKEAADYICTTRSAYHENK